MGQIDVQRSVIYTKNESAQHLSNYGKMHFLELYLPEPRFLPTTREGNVIRGVRHSVHYRPHGYSVTAHPWYSAVGMHPTGMLSC